MQDKNNALNAKLGGGYAWLVWVLGVLFVILLFAMQTGYAISSPYLQHSIGLKIAEIGIAASIYTWVFAVFQFLGGALLDRLGLKKVFTASVLILTIGIFVFANAHSFGTLILSQVLLAIGACTGFVGAGFIGEDWFGPAKFSVMFGAVQAIVSLFSGFSQGLLNFVLTSSNWRGVFDIFGIVGIALVVLFLIFMKNRTAIDKSLHQKPLVADVVSSIYDVAKRGHVWLACISGGISFAVVLALGSIWLPKIITAHGVSISDANICTSLLWIGLAVGSIIVTKCSDLLKGRKLVMLITNIVALVSFAMLLYINSNNVALLFIVSFILGFASAGHMLAFSTAADIVPVHEIGAASALVNGVMFIASGLLIAIPGLIANPNLSPMPMMQHMFILFVILLVIAIIVNFIIKDTYSNA